MKLRSSLSSIFYFSQFFLGRKDKGVRILCYHRVNNANDGYMTVSVSQFKNQMQYLSDHGYSTIGLADLLEERADNKNVIITFDDGYRDNYENAFLIMKKLGFKGTIFCIGEKIGQAGYLTKEEIREMAKSGFEFGSHTLSHRDLPTLHSTEKEREIKDSKSFLSNELELNADYFCYPRGLYDPESVELVKQAGYRAACSNAPGSNCISKNGKRANPFLLKRTEIAAIDSIDDFKKKLAGAYDFLHKVLHTVRGRP